MKKTIIFSIIFIFIISFLTGCDIPKKKSATYESAQNEVEFLINAINRKDELAIKNKFSEYAVNNIDDFDVKIKRLIDEFPGWNENYTISDTFERWSNHGKITYMMTPSFDYEVNGTSYCMRIIYYTESDEDKTKLGWYSLQIFEHPNSNYSDKFYMHGTTDDPDILLWDYTKDKIN